MSMISPSTTVRAARDVVADTSATPANANIYVLTEDTAGTGAQSGGGYQITMASIGGNLSSTDVSNFYTRLRTYMTAVGVP